MICTSAKPFGEPLMGFFDPQLAAMVAGSGLEEKRPLKVRAPSTRCDIGENATDLRWNFAVAVQPFAR
jgi:hypothetical protein